MSEKNAYIRFAKVLLGEADARGTVPRRHRNPRSCGCAGDCTLGKRTDFSDDERPHTGPGIKPRAARSSGLRRPVITTKEERRANRLRVLAPSPTRT